MPTAPATDQTDNEVPQAATGPGNPNGSANVFLLAATPNPPTSLHLHNNGVRLTPGVDYTISAASITFLSPGPDGKSAIPQTGDRLLADYRH